MKVGIDYQTAAGRGGNARYTKELTKCLALLENDIYLYDFLHDFRKRKELPRGAHAYHRFVYLTQPYAPQNIRGFNEAITKLAGHIDGLDIFHFTNPLNIVLGPYSSVVTVHDMSTYTDRNFAKIESHSILAQKLQFILNETQAIIAVSEHTKRDLVERFGVKEGKVTVIYEAAGKEFYPDQHAEICEQIGVTRFVLYAGQLQPRKNIILLIEAFAIAHKQYSDISLVLVGTVRNESYKKEMQEIVTRLDLDKNVVFTGRVDDKTLRQLYSTTECFVYPSLFEGFGLPPLEAMQCGAPVVVSNTSSLPEVVGEAGILIDPTRSGAIAEALARVLGDSKLQTRMRHASIARASKFSWRRTAHETQAVYKNVNVR